MCRDYRLNPLYFACFCSSGISISKIESRPASAIGDRLQRAYHWDYVFYMDLELQARYGGKFNCYQNTIPATVTIVCLLVCPGVAVSDALDAALMNLSEFSISVRELGRYAQNLEKERTYSMLDMEDLAR